VEFIFLPRSVESVLFNFCSYVSMLARWRVIHGFFRWEAVDREI
jgi:hypothetical protein